ncbi:hypothetical protein ACFQ2M_07080 [Kitasatospora saccharophila]|uniref:hypothetical protein n=1 Tax=Kitasatospora saccharophila TaxID=407973 RepID=UPI00364377EF
MAQAIHIRGQLTYAFPIVVDGFIGYGVRALVLLQEAPSERVPTSGRSSPARPAPASGPTRSTPSASTKLQDRRLDPCSWATFRWPA